MRISICNAKKINPAELQIRHDGHDRFAELQIRHDGGKKNLPNYKFGMTGKPAELQIRHDWIIFYLKCGLSKPSFFNPF